MISAVNKAGFVNLLGGEWLSRIPRETVSHDRAVCSTHPMMRRLDYEGRPLAFEPVPFVLSDARFRALAAEFERLQSLIQRVLDAFHEDPGLRAYFALPKRIEELLYAQKRIRPSIAYCRFDFTFDAQGNAKVFELNSASPAGTVMSWFIGQTMKDCRTPRWAEQALDGKAVTLPMDADNFFAREILSFYREQTGRSEIPGVAIVNSRYQTMNNELDLIVEQFRALGSDASKAFVQDFGFDGRHLTHQGRPVQLVYNKFDARLSDENELPFTRSADEVRPFLKAVSTGAALSLNSFDALYLAENKTILAYLHADRAFQLFTREELAFIRALIPESHVISSDNAGAVDRVRSEKDEYVLKTPLDSRGRGVWVGRACSTEEWEQLLSESAQKPGGSLIAQRFVPPMTTLVGGQEHFTTLAIPLFRGHAAGAIVRTSKDLVTNVGKNGFLQPCLVLEDR